MKEGLLRVIPGDKISLIVPSGIIVEVNCNPLLTNPVCSNLDGFKFILRKSWGLPVIITAWLNWI